jgi:hypothetical protein
MLRCPPNPATQLEVTTAGRTIAFVEMLGECTPLPKRGKSFAVPTNLLQFIYLSGSDLELDIIALMILMRDNGAVHRCVTFGV